MLLEGKQEEAYKIIQKLLRMLWKLSFGNRFGVDKIPLELNRRDFTLEERGTTDPVYIRGPKKDLDKRQATIQACVRGKGDQIVAPTLIFRNVNPAENRYEMPPDLRNRKVHFDGRTGPESSFTINVSMLCGKKRHTKKRPLEEFPKAFGYKSGPRNTIFRFASERPGDGSKNSLKIVVMI